MASLSISTAWSEGSRFAAREFRLLYPIALLLMALPGLLVGLLTPQANDGSLYDLQLFVRRNGAVLVTLLSLLLGIAVFVMQTIGSLAITYLALRPGASVAESFSVALRRLPAVLGAVLLIGLGGALVFFPLVLLVGGAGPDPTPGQALALVVLMLVIFVVGMVVYARLLPLTPVGVAEPLGPIAMIRRSWRLTAGHFWPLFGTLLALGIVYLIAALAVSMVFGLLLLATIGSPLTNSTAAFVLELLSALFTSAVAVFLLAFTARIYAQLSGHAGDMGKVFS